MALPDHLARVAHDPQLATWLSARMGQKLPGPLAQARFEPELSFGRHYAPPPPSARQAAVLVLLYPDREGWHLPLTVRPDTMADHAGQVSFPGGALESDEPSHLAALRELREELGVSGENIELLGALSPLYVFASNFYVMPWLAVTHQRPELRHDPVEVAELLEPSLAYLLDQERWASHLRRVGQLEFSAPHIPIGRHLVWGATSMILAELLELLAQRGQELVATHAPCD